MDESLDVDNFYVPLNEKRTYSIIEVFQLWQQIFKETFEQYRRLSCSLLENEDNSKVFELWHDYLMYVQEFLRSPVPGDYHSLTSYERLCQVHQEVLNSQMENLTTCINKPHAVNEPDLIEKITSLTETHNDILTRLEATHQEIWTRIEHWREYRRTIKTVYEWLWKNENIHSNLNLKFINVRRLPQLKTQIQNLLSSLTLESSQVEDLERKQNVIFTFCNKETETGHRKELIAISQRINEIQASLEIWKNYLIKIEKLTNSFNQETGDIDEVLEDVQSQLEQIVRELDSVNKNIIPSDRLTNESIKIQDIRQRLTLLDSKFLIADDARNELKDSLDPIEIRTFGQKLRFLKYHQKDLQHQLFLLTCRLDNLTLKPQEFTERSTEFIHWAIDMDSQLTSLTKSLRDPKFATEILKPEFESQIASKKNEFDWLNNIGHQLIDNESKLNPELAHTTKEKLKEIDEKWSQLKYSIHKHTLELPSKILNINKLPDETNILKSWITDTESKVNRPITFADSSEETLKKELQRLENLKSVFKEKQADYNSLLARCNEQLEGETNSDQSLANASQLENSLKTLSMSWENLECTVERQNSEILTYWEQLKNTSQLISAEHECIDRLKATLGEYNHLSVVELNSLANTINTFEREQQKEKDTWSKLEQAIPNTQSTYTVKFIEEEIEIIGKTRISLEKEISSTLVGLNKSLKLWKDFTNSHRKAVITLTQIDTKLTQLEVLGNTDNVGLKNTKEFGNLQVLEEKLKNIEEHLERTDELGEQLIKESTPNDIKCVQEMIEEYQMLWKDINSRISKLKASRANESPYKKKQTTNEEVQVETLTFGKDFQGQVNTLPTELLKKDTFQNEFNTAMTNATRNVNNLEAAIQNSDNNLSKSLATCHMSIDLIKHLSVILKTQCGVTKTDPNIVQCEQILARYEDLTAKARSQQLTTETNVTNCPMCSEQNWSQFDNDMWRLEHWIQSTEAKLSILPIMPPTNIEQLEDVIQEHREVLLYLDSHRGIVSSLNAIGQHLAEHSSDKERAEQIKNHLSATNSRWVRVSLACTEWQTKLQTALMENKEFYEMIDELVTWLDKTEHTIKTNEPIDLSETTEVITEKFHKFKNIHKELERCEPRIVSLLEASDWLRQINEKSELKVPADDDQNIINSHSRLSHLRARVNALINMTGDYTINLGTVLGYDMTPQNTCRRLHQVDDTSTVLNRSDEGESTTNAGEETVLRRGYQFFGRVMRASLPFQALMLLVLGAASLVPVVDEEFSCMESNNLAWSLYPLLRYPGGPPPV